MRQLTAFTKKEFLESLRTGRMGRCRQMRRKKFPIGIESF